MPQTLALILARGGSKGIPHKNIVPLAGKPLIAWRIESAAACPGIDRIVVSTDDEKIAAVARKAGAETPFLRPAELANDTASSFDAVLHAVNWLETHQGYQPDYVMLMQPTSPLCTTDDLSNALALADQHNADAVISVTPTHHHPYWVKRIDAEGRLENFLPGDAAATRRQDLPDAYALNGAIYLTRREVLKERRSFYGAATYAYVMPPERSLDIDTPWDLRLVEFLLKEP